MNGTQSIGSNAFAFVLAGTVAASTAFTTSVGNQTTLFVDGPGGDTFSAFRRVGVLPQVLLSVVTVLGIAFFWGVAPRPALSGSRVARRAGRTV